MTANSITIASIEDAQEILDLQKLAYTSEAEIIDDFTIPPLHQTIDQILSEFSNQIFLKLEQGERIWKNLFEHSNHHHDAGATILVFF